MSHLEPFDHSVLNAALVARPPDKEPLEHSVLNVALDDALAQESGGSAFGLDCGLTNMEIPDAVSGRWCGPDGLATSRGVT